MVQMTLSKRLMFWVIGCMPLGAVYAAPGVLAEVLASMSAEQQAALQAGELVTEVQFKNIAPRFVPAGAVSDEVKAHIVTLKPSFFVETVFVYTKKRFHQATGWTTAERRALFTHALALSSLAGLRYFSSSRNESRVFYETSVVIDGPATKRPLPDPVYTSNQTKVVYALQKDLTFGENVYQYEYQFFDDALILVQENETPLYVSIIRAVKPHNLRSVVAVIDCGERLLIYAASMAQAMSLPGLKEKVGRSFSSRAEAIMKWFATQADKVF